MDDRLRITVSSGCGGGFAPTLQAGMTNPQAGSYSPFTMTLRRKDSEQSLSTVSLVLPEGVAGMIAKVMPCSEAQANADDCPAASQIGHVTVQAGVGSEPITLPEAGRSQDPVYLTGPYEGAPFGFSIVVPAQAGPFDLSTVVVRAKIEVNPVTAQVSVSSKSDADDAARHPA